NERESADMEICHQSRESESEPLTGISHKKSSAAPRSADRRYADPSCRTVASEDAMPVLYFFVLSSLWMLQFLLFRTRPTSTPVKTAPISRLGMLFQAFGYWAIFFPARTSWREPISAWRIVAATAFGLLGICLASTGVRHLGKQWRMKAALN